MKLLRSIITLSWLTLFVEHVYANNNTLNIYSWGNYLPNEIIRQFTAETGIKVNIAEYDNNETMYAKLKTSDKRTGYDIVIPSSYYIDRMSKQKMLQLLNKKKLPNLRHINPLLLNRDFDPKNKYSVPYLWGSTGIIINTRHVDKKNVKGWQNFWDKQYKDQLMMLNDMRDVFSVALFTLGYSINDTDLSHIKEAYIKIKKLLPNVKIFNIDTVPNIYVDEDAIIGMAWSGDCKLAREDNLDLEYIYPQERFIIWIDSFAILKDAPNIENAYKFINFMSRPKIAKQASLTIGHSPANLAAIKLMPLRLQHNPIFNPDDSIMRRGKIQLDLPEKERHIYEKYWEKLKIGD